MTTSSTTPKTNPSASEAEPLVPGARHVVIPKGIVATSWPRIKRTCQNIGWGFDPWQDAAGRLILAKGESGRWAADLSIMSIPRQVGKSYLLGCIIFALCLLNPKLRVIWTSHHTATTEEMFEAMKELAAHKRVAPHVVKCIALQGSRWRIQFRNGSRIDFGARSQGFGRGKARVGVLVLDEFQHITPRALANLAPTTNTSDNPLILCAGTPPGPELTDSRGEAFRQRRKAALEGLSDDTLYLEFSADSGADPDDRRQWAKANPSFPKRTRERAFLLLKKTLDPDDFAREALGIWDENVSNGAFSPGSWAACATSDEPGIPVALGVSADLDQTWLSLGAVSGDAVPHLGPVSTEDGVLRVRFDSQRERFVAEASRISMEHSIPIVIDKKGPAAPLIPDLEEAGAWVETIGIDDRVQSSADIRMAVEMRLVRHRNYPELNAAVDAATWGHSGDRRLFRRKGGDIAMLEAVTDAWGFIRENTVTPSAYVL